MNGHYTGSREGMLFGGLSEKPEVKPGVKAGEGVGEEELYRDLVHVKQHPNGGATVVHVYQEELEHLTSAQIPALADVFFRYLPSPLLPSSPPPLSPHRWLSGLVGRCSVSLQWAWLFM